MEREEAEHITKAKEEKVKQEAKCIEEQLNQYWSSNRSFWPAESNLFQKGQPHKRHKS